MKINSNIFSQLDALEAAQYLLGKILCSNIDGHLTTGIIVETEAYTGINDKASHSYNNRRTLRTESMYTEGGTAYVYLCYGIHYLFNVVCSSINDPQAVLIRGMLPLKGMNTMLQRRNLKSANAQFGIGPGKLSKALGINKTHDRVDLNGDLIWIEDQKIGIDETKILRGPRVGVDYAEEDALLPYRLQYLKEFSEI